MDNSTQHQISFADLGLGWSGYPGDHLDPTNALHSDALKKTDALQSKSKAPIILRKGKPIP